MLSSNFLERSAFASVDAIAQRPSSYLALAILDGHARVKFSYWSGSEGHDVREQLCENATTLRGDVHRVVADLLRKASAGEATATVPLPDGKRSMRLAPLVGADETLFALVVESDRDDGAMTRAASRFQLTKRQTEVLALVLGGASASDVARTLMISEYTAQGYVKCLLAKTNSRNRAAMVAKVLDWKAPRTGERELSLAIAR